MSFDLINHKLTTSTTDDNGVTWWSNPAINVTISEDGKVKSNDTNQYVPLNKHSGTYSFKLNINKTRVGLCASFNSLFSRMVLGVKLRKTTISLCDKTKGYIKGNIAIRHPNTARMINGDKLPSDFLEGDWFVKDATNDLIESVSNTQQFYTVYEAKNEHTTEDGAVFPTKELAEWHQEKVSKGKGNAQVVLDYNGGYVLAEQIYLQEVVYNKAKPYTNFIDVLNNNQGIVSVVQEEHYVFDKLGNEHGLSTVQLNLFGLDKVINLPCTKLQAEKINTSLNKYSEAFSKLEDEHKTLKDLLKQVS